jgi:ADP-ribose pyrophosphatase YjhB (NUDIX family)
MMHEEKGWKDGDTYVGVGGTLEEAFENAATAAVRESRENVGRRFEVVRWVVTVDNPRISEHKVTISGT